MKRRATTAVVTSALLATLLTACNGSQDSNCDSAGPVKADAVVAGLRPRPGGLRKTVIVRPRAKSTSRWGFRKSPKVTKKPTRHGHSHSHSHHDSDWDWGNDCDN